MGGVQEIHFRCQSTHSLGAVQTPPTDTQIGRPHVTKEDAEQIDGTDFQICEGSINIGHYKTRRARCTPHPAEQVNSTDDLSRGELKEPQDWTGENEVVGNNIKSTTDTHAANGNTGGFSRGQKEPQNLTGDRDDLSRGQNKEPQDRTGGDNVTDGLSRGQIKEPQDLTGDRDDLSRGQFKEPQDQACSCTIRVV